MDSDKKNISVLYEHFSVMWKICVGYGVLYAIFAYNCHNGIGNGIFALISVVAFIFTAKYLKENNIEDGDYTINISKECIFYYVAAIIIAFSSCINDNDFFMVFNFIANVLLFSIANIKLFYDDTEWGFAKYVEMILTFFVALIEALPYPIHDMLANAKRKDKKEVSPTRKGVIIGIICGLPILLVTTILLASADEIFSDVLEGIFDFSGIFSLDWLGMLGEHIVKFPIMFVFYTFLIYLVFGALTKGRFNETVGKPRQFGVTIAITIFSMIDIVYIVFSIIQILFLFAGIPVGYDYAKYARKGFFELVFVALINFVLVIFCNKHFARNLALKILMTVTCACTYVMMVSSAYRMILYIEAYNLTFLRVFVLWFLLMLAFLMAGSTISIYKTDWKMFKYCMVVVVCFYTIFALAGVDSHIAKYDISRFEEDLADNMYGKEKPSLSHYLPEDYNCSKVYGEYLANLNNKYNDSLGSDNKILIKKYLSLENRFYDYSSEYDLELPRECYIYDSDLKCSLLLWKGYNFVEDKCYKACKQFSEK